MTTEKRKRRRYTADFKREAVALVTEQGYSVAEAARFPPAGCMVFPHAVKPVAADALRIIFVNSTRIEDAG